MEEIPFTIVFRGVARVYNKEHAEDEVNKIEKNVIDELNSVRDYCGDVHYSVKNITTKIGDDLYVEFRESLYQHMLESSITKEINDIVGEFLDYMKTKLEKPPIFDRRDYIEVRNEILNVISELKGENNWTARVSNRISNAARNVEKNVIEELKINLENNIIRSVEGGEKTSDIDWKHL